VLFIGSIYCVGNKLLVPLIDTSLVVLPSRTS
jgi:hypothetical protein